MVKSDVHISMSRMYVRNYGLRVCGLIFTSLEARFVVCQTRKLELLTPSMQLNFLGCAKVVLQTMFTTIHALNSKPVKPSKVVFSCLV